MRTVTPPPAPAEPEPPRDAAARDAARQPAVQGDAQVAHVMITANNGEVEQGTLAQTRATDANVRTFADMMVAEHGDALQRTQALATQKGIVPEDNPVSAALANESRSVLAQLQPLAGSNFDTSYMRSQVTVHTRVLRVIDDTLIPAVVDPDLRAELTAMRGTVAGHLQQAQQILRALDADAGRAGAEAGAAEAGAAEAGVPEAGADAYFGVAP